MTHIAQLRIGIPRALLYHKYGTLWTHFFQSLGFQVITSPNTNRQILENGIRYSIDENCLAMKIFLGHVHYLVDKVDYLFIPSYDSVEKNESLCSKFQALSDIVRNTFTDVALLEYYIDVTNRQYQMMGFIRIGFMLHQNIFKTLKAYHDSQTKLMQYEQARQQKQIKRLSERSPQKTRVLLAAHAYISYDLLLGRIVSKFLEELDVEVIFSDALDPKTACSVSSQMSTDIYWTYNKEQIGAIQYYREHVDGIIFLMAFPCGPDALAISLCQNRIDDLPACVLIMDELQGDAGLKTRIESFIDILRFKTGQLV